MQSQDKQEQLIKLSKEEEEIQKQQEKQRETEQRAQQKYKVWLQKKNQEQMELEKKDKVIWSYSAFNDHVCYIYIYVIFDQQKQTTF